MDARERIYDDLSLEDLYTKAENGEAQAQYEMGMRAYSEDWLPDEGYIKGEYGDEDYDEKIERVFAFAIKTLEKAAKQGHTGAKLELGILLDDPYPEIAFYWNAQAAKDGEVEAIANMAEEYLGGGRSNQDPQPDLDFGAKLMRIALEKSQEPRIWGWLESEHNIIIKHIDDNLTRMDECARAYLLRELSHSDICEVSERANRLIDGLSEDVRSIIHRIWHEIKDYEDAGNFSLHNSFLGYEKEARTPQVIWLPPEVEDLYNAMDYEKYDDFTECLLYRIIMGQPFYKRLGEDVPTWIRIAAEYGEVRYQYALGIYFRYAKFLHSIHFNLWGPLFSRPDDVDDVFVPEVDFEKSRYWLTKAAEQGFEPAIRELIKLYEEDLNTEEYRDEAIKWSKKI